MWPLCTSQAARLRVCLYRYGPAHVPHNSWAPLPGAQSRPTFLPSLPCCPHFCPDPEYSAGGPAAGVPLPTWGLTPPVLSLPVGVCLLPEGWTRCCPCVSQVVEERRAPFVEHLLGARCGAGRLTPSQAAGAVMPDYRGGLPGTRGWAGGQRLRAGGAVPSCTLRTPSCPRPGASLCAVKVHVLLAQLGLPWQFPGWTRGPPAAGE